ncbi:MAG TPA: prepilin-type N-terminal cleavage/methylation domain-containing protein [Gemmatimonadales bacterium]|jgi:prepilin-type N-terminal cleavage/methylation domain-containing protein
MRQNKGFTVVELLVSMVVLLVVLAGALQFVTAQSRTFRRGADDMAVVQNLSYGVDNLDSQIRTSGGNTTDAQPPVVYASDSVFAFNADYVSNDANDISAVYIDPDAPPEQVAGLTTALQIGIPGSAPNFNYPTQNYADGSGFNSAAETITFFFTRDASTSRTDDFLLMRQVNNQPAEVLIRNVLPDSTDLPFFRYYRLLPPAAVNLLPLLGPVPANQLPLKHTFATHGDQADTTRIDSLRTVLVSYQVTNGRTGTSERKQRISFKIPLPNMGLRMLKICGSAPVLGINLAAAAVNVAGVNKVNLTWPRAFDENSGEKDVVRYVLWRRRTAPVAEVYGDPLTSVTATGAVNYAYTDAQNVLSGSTYEYQLSAQDCSPKLSPAVTTVVVIP